MIEELKQVFGDIRNSIVEMGVEIDDCTSIEEYANRIKLIKGNNAMLFVPVFKSSVEKPERPTVQMSSNNPTDYPEGWSTPDGLVDDIWMTYTIVGPERVYVDWTEPVLIYSTGESGGGQVIPKGATRTFLIYAEWPDRDVELDTPQGGHWDANQNELTGNVTSIVRKDGEQTSDLVYWSTDNAHQAGSFTWLSTGTFLAETGEMIGDWSDPVCINYAQDGTNGRNGVDGDLYEYIYKLLHSVEEISQLDRPYSNPDVDDYVPSGWTDSPLSIDPDNYPVEAMCYRKRDKETRKWGQFSMPIPWAIWGQDGTDGDGVEYIFLIAAPDQCQQHDDGSWELTDSTVFPPLNQSQYLAQTRLTGISDELALQAYQNDEFIPGDNALAQSLNWDRNWTDDPSDVSEDEPLEFVSIRKYRKNQTTGESEWSWYSTPRLWNKWAYVDSSIFTAFAFTRTNENLAALSPALVIEGGSENNPIPDPSHYTKGGTTHTVTWHDSVPSDNGTVWMTQRVFGQPNSTWTSPSKMADTDRFQVEYSNSGVVTLQTVLPSLNGYITDANPEGVDEAAWRAYCNSQGLGVWKDDDTIVDPLWMATCNKVDGIWSPWHIARIRGENSIRIDFTNDKDELIYDAAGNKISNRNVTTTAKLYDGSTEVTSNVTWRFNTVSGVNTPSGMDAIGTFPTPLGTNAAYIKTNGDIVVTGIKSDADEVVILVEATYNGAQYYKQFWVGKVVGRDNYYLDFTPGVIVYNTSTNTPSSVNMNVKVMKESYIDGSISTAIPSGYKVFLYDGNTIDTNWTTANKDYTLSLNSNIRDLKLLLATAKTGGTVEDGPEDILVNFISDGADGNDGEDGRGIVSTAYYYMWSNDGTNHPAESSSSWSSNIPANPNNLKYLWKKTVITYNKAPLTETTYEIVSTMGDTGHIGPKMRMRNWDYYTNPDAEGLDEWQCGDNDTDSYYDIAIWPVAPDGITVDQAYANVNSLWRCKQNLKYANVPANANPSTLPNYFVQAVGWDFIATKLLLADKINANQIDVNGLNAKAISTDTVDGSNIIIAGNTMELKKQGTIKCKISANPITVNASNWIEKVWETPLGYRFAGGAFNQGITKTINLGSFTIAEDGQHQVDTIYSSAAQQINLDFIGTWKQGVGPNTVGNVGVYTTVRMIARNQATQQDTIWYQAGYGQYVWLFTTAQATDPGNVYQSGDNKVDWNFTLDTTDPENFNVGVYDLLLEITVTDSGLSTYFENMELYLSQYQTGPSTWIGAWDAIVRHTAVSSEIQYTDIGTDGFAHVLDGNNYFFVRKENTALKLEFFTGGTYGLRVTDSGIEYTKTGPSGWTNLV